MNNMHTFLRFGDASERAHHIDKRRRSGLVWHALFISATALAVLFLMLLLVSVIDSVFGYAALQNEVEPSQLIPGARSVSDFSRSEEHTSELQSRPHLVCRLLLEKKKH